MKTPTTYFADLMELQAHCLVSICLCLTFETWTLNFLFVYTQSHSGKTLKTAPRSENFDERRRDVIKMQKSAVFKFILCLYYVAVSTSLSSSHSV